MPVTYKAKRNASRVVLGVGIVATAAALYYTFKDRAEEEVDENIDYKRGVALGWVLPGPFAVGAVLALVYYGV